MSCRPAKGLPRGSSPQRQRGDSWAPGCSETVTCLEASSWSWDEGHRVTEGPEKEPTLSTSGREDRDRSCCPAEGGSPSWPSESRVWKEEVRSQETGAGLLLSREASGILTQCGGGRGWKRTGVCVNWTGHLTG